MLPPASVDARVGGQLQQAVEQRVDVVDARCPAAASSDSSASRGAPPIAATSLRLTASAL